MEPLTFWKRVQRWIEVFELSPLERYHQYHLAQREEIDALKTRILQLENRE